MKTETVQSLSARRKLSATEHELSEVIIEVIFEQVGGSNQDFAVIRSKGDHALFGKTAQAMKSQWKVPDGRPLADFAPTRILMAKDSKPCTLGFAQNPCLTLVNTA
jgi:DNA-damage-inducible protein D